MIMALAGGVVAFVIVFAIYYGAILFSRARKLNIPGGAFGQGDITLATFMGLVVGLQNVFPAIVLTILLGGAGASTQHPLASSLVVPGVGAILRS